MCKCFSLTTRVFLIGAAIWCTHATAQHRSSQQVREGVVHPADAHELHSTVSPFMNRFGLEGKFFTPKERGGEDETSFHRYDRTVSRNEQIPGSFPDRRTEEWVRHYGSGLMPASDRSNAVVVDAGGNVYITGVSTGLPWGRDYLTIKLNASGDTVWTARYNGPGNADDWATALALDRFGNVVVTGYSWGMNSSYDYATIKYGASGNQLWVARYNGPGNFSDYASCIFIDEAGNIYVSGSSWNTSHDYATVKYDPTGNQLWVVRYDGPANGDDGANAIAVDAAGNVYVTGWSTGTGSLKDYTTIKYNNIGTQLWVARYNGPANDSDVATALAVDSAGNVLVTGVSVGAGTFEDYATVKYDAAGNHQWTARYNGPGNGNDGATAVVVDRAGGSVYVTGYAWGDVLLLTMDDYATIKYDAAGNLVWVASYNGPDSFIDRATALALDGNGNVLVTGVSWGLTAADYATVKYNSAGMQLWANRYNGAGNADDQALALGVDAAGNVYVTGFAFEGQTADDYCAIKYSAGGSQVWRYVYNGVANCWDRPTAMTLDGSGNVTVTGTSARSTTTLTDYLTIQYDAAGNQRWIARYALQDSSWGVPTAITSDGSGNIYVTGYVWASGSTFINYLTMKYNSSGVLQWAAQYNGPGSGNDYAWAIAVDQSGNVYVTGESVGSGTSYDYATIKYSPGGTQLWVARYNGPPGNGADYANALTLDRWGNVYVTGESRSAPTGNTFDYATIKYDGSGNERWVARYNGPGNHNDRARAIAVDSFANVYVTGSSRGAGSLEDYATITYDSSGNQHWVARYDGPSSSYDYVAALALDRGGNVYVTGTSYDAATTYDIATVKYSAEGIQQWVARYNMGPGASSESAAHLGLDHAGNVYVLASAFDGFTFDYFVTNKYDSAGTLVWNALYEGPGHTHEQAQSLALDDAGNVYVTGSSDGTVWSVFTTIKYHPQPTPVSEPTYLPTGYFLFQNYPNPFNSSTRIPYSVRGSGLPAGQAGFVSLKVYDVLGREVVTLVNEVQGSGFTSVQFDGSNLPSGVYYYRLSSGNFTQTRRMILIR